MVALVTGASAGIGKATALRLLKDGLTVYAAARRMEKMQDLKEKGVHVLKMDVTDKQSIEAALSIIQKAHGGVDVLVNNAGVAEHGAVEDVSIDKAKAEFDVNLFGAVYLIDLCLPHMRQNRYGKIINVTSIAGRIFAPMTGWYFSSKYALEGLSKCLRIEAKSFGIDVVIIEPGLISSEMADITISNLIRNSGNGEYSASAKFIGKFMNSYKPIESSPDVVARAISRAVKSKHPKHRYAVGRFAKLSLLLFWVVPDRLLTKIYTIKFKSIMKKQIKEAR